MNRRLEEAKAHAWRRWKREYIHSLMEGHRLNKKEGATPVVGEVPWRVEERESVAPHSRQGWYC